MAVASVSFLSPSIAVHRWLMSFLFLKQSVRRVRGEHSKSEQAESFSKKKMEPAMDSDKQRWN
jgi:hypothetical protein